MEYVAAHLWVWLVMALVFSIVPFVAIVRSFFKEGVTQQEMGTLFLMNIIGWFLATPAWILFSIALILRIIDYVKR